MTAPGPHRLQREQNTAIAALREAAALCRRLQAGIVESAKAARSPAPAPVETGGLSGLAGHASASDGDRDPHLNEERRQGRESEQGQGRRPGTGQGQGRALGPERDQPRPEANGAPLRKADLSPVTLADFGSQALVCRMLERWLPEDSVVAEEDATALQAPENAALLSGLVSALRETDPDLDAAEICRFIDRGRAEGNSRRFWTLDPIDGTKGFVRGDQYAISLALIEDGEVTLGALACPNLGLEPLFDGRLERAAPGDAGSLLIAVKDRGVSLLPLDDPAEAGRPVRVSARSEAGRARLCESVESGHTRHELSARITARLGSQEPPIRLDSQAKYAAVAVGAAELYLRLPTERRYRERIWDHAGGVRVVLEAGGRVSDVLGRELDFSRGRNLEANRGVVVSNGLLHEPLIEALREAGVG